jgi:hypothetical protein
VKKVKKGVFTKEIDRKKIKMKRKKRVRCVYVKRERNGALNKREKRVLNGAYEGVKIM